jgi:hypothetical protein
MAPGKDRDKHRKPARREFEVGRDTDESGRPLQRKAAPMRRDDSTDSVTAASHGEEPSAQPYAPLPREDRAG